MKKKNIYSKSLTQFNFLFFLNFFKNNNLVL